MFIGKKDLRTAAVIAAAYLIPRIILMMTMPFILDEALFSMMASEQGMHPTAIATLFGYPISWKPAPFFWTYAILSWPSLKLGLPLEVAYRLPSLLFGLLSLPLLYAVLRKAGATKGVALCSLVAFIFSGISLYPQSTVLTDSPMLFFILLSLYLYLDESLGRNRHLAAGAAAFAGFFFKVFFAFIPPILALVWFFWKDRKTLKDPCFLASLLFPAVAMGITVLQLQGVGLGTEFFTGNAVSHLVSGEGLLGQLKGMIDALSYLFLFAPVWLGLSIVGFARHWRENLLMSAWYALLAIPLLSSLVLPWYYLPVVPAISYFAALVLVRSDGKEKTDEFFYFTLALIAIASLAFYAVLEYYSYSYYNPERVAGTLVAGKENVLIIGSYKPSIAAYKVLSERRAGEDLDFGWIILGPGANGTVMDSYVRDYNYSGYNVTQGSLSGLFLSSGIFRKDSNLTRFDYVVVAGERDYRPAGSTRLYSDDQANIYVYRVG